MNDDLERHVDTEGKSESWDRLLENAGPCDHIVQLYQDEDFLSRAVCRFAGGALANGEGIILVPTLAHWNAIRPRLEAEGVDVNDRKSIAHAMVFIVFSGCATLEFVHQRPRLSHSRLSVTDAAWRPTTFGIGSRWRAGHPCLDDSAKMRDAREPSQKRQRQIR